MLCFFDILNLDRKSIKGANRLGVAWAQCVLSTGEPGFNPGYICFFFLMTRKYWLPLNLNTAQLHCSADMPSRCFYIPGKKKNTNESVGGKAISSNFENKPLEWKL